MREKRDEQNHMKLPDGAYLSRQWRLSQLADWLSERDRVWPSPSAPLPFPSTALEE